MVYYGIQDWVITLTERFFYVKFIRELFRHINWMFSFENGLNEHTCSSTLITYTDSVVIVTNIILLAMIYGIFLSICMIFPYILDLFCGIHPCY